MPDTMLLTHVFAEPAQAQTGEHANNLTHFYFSAEHAADTTILKADERLISVQLRHWT